MSLAKDSTLTSGALRGVSGNMAKVSWADLPGNYTVLFGSASANVNRQESQDGGLGAIALNCGVAGPIHSVTYGAVAQCTAVGIRGRRNGNAATAPPVDMIVDGRCVEAFRTTNATINGLATGTYVDYEATFEWPHQLKRTQHTFAARVDGNPDGTTVNNFLLSGWLLSRTDGFRDSPAPVRKGFVTASVALTTTAATITTSTDQAIRGITFGNTDSSAHTVTLYREDGTTIYAIISVPAGAGVTVDRTRFTFPQPYNLTSWKIKVDANSFVNYWMEGA